MAARSFPLPLLIFVALLSSTTRLTDGAADVGSDYLFDVAIVVISEPYAVTQFDQVDAADTTGVRDFMRAFLDQLPVGEDGIRVAVFNAFVNATGQETFKVLHRLDQPQSPALIGDAAYRLAPKSTRGSGAVVQPDKLADKVDSEVFKPEFGHRKNMPKAIVVMAIDQMPQLVSRAPTFKGVPVRFFAPSFAMSGLKSSSGDPVNAYVSYNHDKMDELTVTHVNTSNDRAYGMGSGGILAADKLKQLQIECERKKMTFGECYYDKYGKCVREATYGASKTSYKAYCFNDPIDALCDDESKCNTSCVNLQKWSACDCKINKETAYYTKPPSKGVKTEHFQYCPFIANQTRDCKCNVDNPSSKKPFPTVLVISVSVAVGAVLVIIIVVVVIVVVVLRKRKAQTVKRGVGTGGGGSTVGGNSTVVSGFSQTQTMTQAPTLATQVTTTQATQVTQMTQATTQASRIGGGRDRGGGGGRGSPAGRPSRR